MIFPWELRESSSMAWAAIKSNKLRSSLTLLGIVVGVFSIIAVMTAMRVLQNSIEKGLSFLGTNTFQVQKYPVVMIGGPGHYEKYRNRKDITLRQGEYVREHARLPVRVGLETWSWGKVVKSDYAETNPNVGLMGETPDATVANNLIVAEGRGMTEEDLELARNVAFLGNAVAKKLFPNTYPVGQAVKIDGRRYLVGGVYQEQGSLLGGNQDNFVAIPLTTFIHTYGQERSINILVQARSPELYQETIDEVRSILRVARNVPPGTEDDFAIFSNDSLIKQFNDLTFYVKLGIGFISFIALLAAGVGIMNIMLVSVTERTREIGIRKAVGARRGNILAQFIVESVFLSEIGGVVGVILGIVSGNIAALLFHIPPAVPYDWALIGLMVCSFVGIVFGVYPAWKAATLNPIEALRYE